MRKEAILQAIQKLDLQQYEEFNEKIISSIKSKTPTNQIMQPTSLLSQASMSCLGAVTTSNKKQAPPMSLKPAESAGRSKASLKELSPERASPLLEVTPSHKNFRKIYQTEAKDQLKSTTKKGPAPANSSSKSYVQNARKRKEYQENRPQIENQAPKESTLTIEDIKKKQQFTKLNISKINKEIQ